MSSTMPASLKGGPITTNALPANRYILLYIFILWLALVPDFFLITHFFVRFQTNFLWILVIFPLELGAWYLIFVLGTIIWAWICYKIVSYIHRPREGVFPREMADSNYKYWAIRAMVRKLPIWVCHNFPFPYLDIVAFKLFGNNVPMSTALFDAWVDSEFLEIDKKTTIGQGAVILTSMITAEFLLIKRVKIGKNCVIGSHSVISPGTVVGDNVILAAFGSTSYGQILEPNWIYMGNPAQKFRENEYREKDGLTPTERALHRGYKDIIRELPEGPEVFDPDVDRLIRKSARNERAAAKSEGKARYYVTRAEFSHLREQLKAEKFELRAAKRKFESDQALEEAKQKIISKRKQSTPAKSASPTETPKSDDKNNNSTSN